MSDTRLDHARDVLRLEADAVRAQIDHLGAPFLAACDLLLATRGHVIVTGLGKSGHIGEKIAATLASTGTPAFFVHAAEAGHGDLGMITADDTILAISYSGESQEILMMLPIVRALGVKTIALTGRPQSSMAQQADLHLPVVVAKEACPLGLAPTTSTTAVMALGDALAVVLLRARAFTPDDFALSHPAGSLGKRLLLRVADIMHGGDALPAVVSGTLLKEAIVRMSEKGLGMLAVTDEAGRLKGVLTDGDLRRLFQQRDNFAGLTVDDIMHTSPKTITADKLATEALKHMQANHINGLLVTEADGTLTGALNMHDLLMARIV